MAIEINSDHLIHFLELRIKARKGNSLTISEQHFIQWFEDHFLHLLGPTSS